MNLIGKIASGLMAQSVAHNYNSIHTKSVSKTQEPIKTNSFNSILKLMDVNADDSLDANELRVGLENYISGLFLLRDLDGDQALNASEAGISKVAISELDANSDRFLDAGEITTEAGRILDGLVSILDTNNDKSLSVEELAIFELLFSSASPGLDTNTIFERSLSSTGETLALNMDTIPDRMRQAGFQGSDNALYYALAHVYNVGPGKKMPDEGDESLANLNAQREEIYQWFDGEVAKVENILRKNPQVTLTAITNDGRDKCGFRLGPAILERLKEFGDRVQLGNVLPVSEY